MCSWRHCQTTRDVGWMWQTAWRTYDEHRSSDRWNWPTRAIWWLTAQCIFQCMHVLLPPIKEEINVFARVCLSVCLLARLLKNAWMDLDEMLPVDRCRDMDELIKFWARSGFIVRMLEPDCFLRYCMCCNVEFYYIAKIPPIGIGRCQYLRGFTMVLLSASRRNNFVGNTCALPSALLVIFATTSPNVNWFLQYLVQ